MVVEDGKERSAAGGIGDSRPSVGADSPVILDLDSPNGTGRKRAYPGLMLDGIIFQMRSGCQWNRLPRELGDDSTIHRTFRRWVELGVLESIRAVLVEGCGKLGRVDWEWQPTDCSMGKACFGRTPLDATQPAGAKTGVRRASWPARRVAP